MVSCCQQQLRKYNTHASRVRLPHNVNSHEHTYTFSKGVTGTGHEQPWMCNTYLVKEWLVKNV